MTLTMRDIARMCGTSPSAVSLVLNQKDEGKVKPHKREAILAAVEKYQFRKNTIAQSLKMNKYFKVAVCIRGVLSRYPIMGNYSQYDFISQFAFQLYQYHYGIDLVQLEESLSLIQIGREIDAHNVDGFLFVNWPADPVSKLMFHLDQQMKPAVSFGTEVADSSSWVIYDRATSFYQGTCHLFDQGSRRVAVLEFDLLPVYTDIKYKAYEKACQERGLTPLPLFFCARPTVKGVVDAVEHLLKTVPDVDGVLLTDNGLVAPVVHALAPHGIRVVGFGDEGFVQLCDPRPAYMRFPIAAAAESCVNFLLNRIDPAQPERPVIHTHLCEWVSQEG